MFDFNFNAFSIQPISVSSSFQSDAFGAVFKNARKRFCSVFLFVVSSLFRSDFFLSFLANIIISGVLLFPRRRSMAVALPEALE